MGLESPFKGFDQFVDNVHMGIAQPFARSNKFQFQLIGVGNLVPVIDDRMNMYCSSTELPDIAIDSNQSASTNNRPERNYAISANWATFSASFYLSHDYRERTFFERWIDSIYHRGSGTVAYFDDYIAQVKVSALASNTVMQTREGAEKTYEVTLNEVYPISISKNEMTMDAGTNVSIMSIKFNYTDFTTEITKET
jgi:hypothetical protein